MRFLRALALWLGPSVIHSRTVPAAPVDGELPELQAHEEPDAPQSRAAFNVPCQADDEAFAFSFQVLEPSNSAACGSSNVLVNDQPLHQDWTTPQWLRSGQGRSNVTVASSIDDLNHTLELSSKSVCIASTLTGAGNSPFPASEGEAIQITFVHIESIDGRPSLSETGFTVSFDHLRRQIIGVRPSLDDLSTKPSEDSDSASIISDDTSIEAFPTPSVISDESSKLQYLQNELDALTLTVSNQQAVVDGLISTDDTNPTIKLTHCRDVKCLAQTVYQRARHCVHVIVLHLTPQTPPPPHPTIDPDCYWTHTRQSRMFAAMHGEKLCSSSPPPSPTSNTPTPTKTTPATSSKTASSERPSATFSSGHSHHANTDKYHALILPLSAIASLCCLSCLTLHLHRSCCSPRARAERAARCEERRTRRQYARLAREHKFRTWWNRRLGRNNQPSSSDYEEKRSLIRAQERVLEDAMQEQILRIRREAGGASDEETGECLPPYRSRAGSGRPPSYTSEAVDVESPVRGLVDGGECGLVDGLVDDGCREPGRRSPTGDTTPDSSIANLSRRNSSDTLHSGLSLI